MDRKNTRFLVSSSSIHPDTNPSQTCGLVAVRCVILPSWLSISWRVNPHSSADDISKFIRPLVFVARFGTPDSGVAQAIEGQEDAIHSRPEQGSFPVF